MELLYRFVNPWWEGKDFITGVTREDYVGPITSRLWHEESEVLIGGLGVGKTTILKQIIKHLLTSGTPAAAILYLPLHYPGLSSLSLTENLLKVQTQLIRNRKRIRYLLVDEIQEEPGWEREIKKACFSELSKIFAAATVAPPVRGRGRQATTRIETTVYPLTFREFMRFRDYDFAGCSSERYVELAEDYLQTGGYPAQVIDPASETLTRIIEVAPVQIVGPFYQVRKSHRLRDFLTALACTIGTRTSYRRLAEELRLSIGTIKDYLGHLEESWLIKRVERWSSVTAERTYAPKKFYLGDNGLQTILTGDMVMAGRAENAVFLELWRKGVPCGYDGEGTAEVDFVLGPRSRPVIIDVRYDPSPGDGDGRYEGVRSFIHRFPRTRAAIVITRDGEDAFKIGRTEVRAMPLWKALTTEEMFTSL